MAELIPMSRWSNAMSPGEYLKDVSTRMLRKRQEQEQAPETLGVTVPFNAPADAAGLGDQMRDWHQQMLQRKGPAAYDSPDTPHEGGYAQRRYEFLSGEEGVRKVAYDDANGVTITEGYQKKGLVTVGIGFNMDQPGAKEMFSRATGLGEKEFDAVYAGKRALTDVEVRKLFDFSINSAENEVSRKLKGVPLNEHQRLALVSLAFNSPALIGPKLTKAIQEGNWKAASDEILFNSNKNLHPGLAQRRYREVHLFNGPGGGPAKLPDFESYMRVVRTKDKQALLSLMNPTA